MKKKTRAEYSAFMLVGGPKNMPLMLEQSGVRYATLFTSEQAVSFSGAEIKSCCRLADRDGSENVAERSITS